MALTGAAGSRANLLSYEEAVAAVLAHAEPLPLERLALGQSAGRYLAEPLTAWIDLPRFSVSSVDGYGLRAADTCAATAQQPVPLQVVGTIHAGDDRRAVLQPGQAVLLMTGAAVPPGVDAVVMREDAAEQEQRVLIPAAAAAGLNIRVRGGDCRQGDLLAEAGANLTPALIALMAAQGCAEALVRQVPRIALFVTGDELVPPGQPLAGGQIYDAISAALQAAAREAKVQIESACLCEDDPDRIARAINQEMRSADVLIVSGGASQGDKDFVREVCLRLGMQIVFHGIAIKPGKPTLFATYARQDGKKGLLFGLPGNPVAALVLFDRLVLPAVRRMMGAAHPVTPSFRAVLGGDLHKQAGRLEYVRGSAAPGRDGLEVEPVIARDSHMLKGVARANCLIAFPRESEHLAAGSLVDITWLYRN